MNYILKVSLYLFFALVSFSETFSQNDKLYEHADMIVKTSKKFHYNPREVDDAFGKLVFSRMIDLLDYRAMIFTKEDIETLKKHTQEIDNDILNKRGSFFENISKLYTKRLERADSIVLSFQNSSFDFNKKDTFIFKKQDNRVTEKDIKNKWKNVLKIKVIFTCLSYNDSNISKSNFPNKKLDSIKKHVVTSASCRLKSKLENKNELNNFLKSAYLNSIAYAFDPHSVYFTEEEKKEFERLLSKDVFSFGMTVLLNNQDQIEVENIIPGGSAWKSNKINVGDVILKATLPNGDVKNFDCINNQDANSFLSSSDIKTVTFQVQKKDKKKIDVTLIKTKGNNEDNIINSFLLNGNVKVGYIGLPSFYSNFEGNVQSLKGCANDLAKEVIKLKHNGAQGIILDLRNNGGGSMMEAIRMAGIFINYGAIAIIKNRGDDAITVKDMDRGVAYGGPLVVMINEYSASASELFASTMQDYNRAVLVGAKTFGKSTIQTILPIEAFKSEKLTSFESKEGAYLKITSGKFFRITGKCHQNIGVKPDIELYKNENAICENDFSSSLKNTTINKKTYYSPLAALPIDELKKWSKSRLHNGKKRTNVSFLSEENILIPLNIDLFVEYYNNKMQKNEFATETSPFVVKNFEFIDGLSGLTGAETEINEKIIENIKKDNDIIEAYLITNDLIKIKH